MGDDRDEVKQRGAGDSFSPTKLVDVDGEHDAKRARLHSNAALRTIADSGAKAGKDPKAAANKAGSFSNAAAQGGLLAFAERLRAMIPELAAAQKSDESGFVHGLENIEHIVGQLDSDARYTGMLVSNLERSTREKFAPDVQQVLAAWTIVRPKLDASIDWYRETNKKEGDASGGRNLMTNSIDLEINAYVDKVGMREEGLKPTETDLANAQKGTTLSETDRLEIAQIKNDIEAATVALDSLEAGNRTDSDVGKLSSAKVK